jgi:hypothetical protein
LCSKVDLNVVAESSVKENFSIHCDLKTTPSQCDEVYRNGLVTIPPPNIPLPYMYAYRPCPHNALSSLVGRVGLKTPPVEPRAIHELKQVANQLSAHLKLCSRWTMRQVCDSYSGKKRRTYERAYHDLVYMGSLADKKLKLFTKIETAAYKITKPFPSCRPIQFRDFKFAIELATYIKPFEHSLYSIANTSLFGVGRTFFKGMNSKQRGRELFAKWKSFKNPHAYGFDAHRYDAHINNSLLSVEHSVFLKAFPHPKHLKKLLQVQFRDKGRCRFKCNSRITYSVEGTRKSGEMTTAAGNCIVMATALSWALAKTGVEFTIADDGDDSVVITEGPIDPNQVINDMKQLGLVMELEGHWTEFEEISFCQCKPILINDQYVMVRDPFRSIAKTLSNVKFCDPFSIPKRLRTIAAGELSLVRGIPILQDFYKRLFDIATERMSARSLARNSGFDLTVLNDYRLARELKNDWRLATTAPIQQQTRASFSRAFNIPEKDQISYEIHINQWNLPPDLTPVHELGIDHRWCTPINTHLGMGFCC